MRRGAPVVLSMSTMNADRDQPASTARVADARSPFVRLAELLGDLKPGKPPINLSVGEPQHPIPQFVGPVLAAHLAQFGRYPLGKGTARFRSAAADWLGRRYKLKRPLDPENEIIVLSGTREGLFLAAIAAKRWVASRAGKPAILIPNPFYVPYAAAAQAADCEPVYLAADAAHAFLPDLDRIDEELWGRTVAIYLASPSNPQGAVADLAYLTRLAALARRHGFLVFAALSKRSSLPGLRVGFAAGDRRFLAKFLDLRNVASAQVPEPAQEVAVVAYGDEAHVEENRKLYTAKFDLADQIIGDRYGYRRPAGSFFLWLNVAAHGGSEQAALRLWREAGLRVLPGRYIARDQADGSNPGADYIRVALVQDKEATAEALHRLVAALG